MSFFLYFILIFILVKTAFLNSQSGFRCVKIRNHLKLRFDKYYITEKLQEFKTEKEYNEFASNKNLPKSSELKSFKENYSEYWSGWRFFLLP